MKEFIGRFSSAVSVRGRSDYVLMVMRVRQRERWKEGGEGKREREWEEEKGTSFLSFCSLWSLAGGREMRHGCNLIKILLFVRDLPLC